MRFDLIIICSLVVLWSANLCAQSPEADLVGEIQKAYESLNYQEAEIKADAALGKYDSFTPEQLVEIHKVLGLIYFTQGKTRQSEEQFRLALSIDPGLKLDPLLVSPKILDFFNGIQLKRKQNDLQKPENPEIRYVFLHDLRPAAALRSMVLPGWGQLYKKDKRKGVVFLSLWGAGVIGSVVSHSKMQNAKDAYLAETNSEFIESKYDTYNAWFKRRNNLMIASAAIWVLSYFDAIISNSRLDYGDDQKANLNVDPISSPQDSFFQLGFKFSF